jgi:hypothetical protein
MLMSVCVYAIRNLRYSKSARIEIDFIYHYISIEFIENNQ